MSLDGVTDFRPALPTCRCREVSPRDAAEELSLEFGCLDEILRLGGGAIVELSSQSA